MSNSPLIYRLDEMDLIPPTQPCQCNGVRVTNPAVWPQAADEEVKRLLPPDPRPRCSFCRGTLTDLFDAYLILYDGPTLAYPGEPEDLLAAYSHSGCGPDRGYNIDFPRLLSDGVGDELNSWYRHLQGKVWFCETFRADLEHAYAGAKAVRDQMPAVAESMRSIADSIPRRRPRTPDNPRAISTGTRTRVLERDGFRCRRCGHGPDVAPLVVDHIIPVAKGGTAAIENLQTLCRPCNAGKSDREPTPHDMGARS